MLGTGLMELIAPAEFTQAAVQAAAGEEEYQTKDEADTRHHCVASLIIKIWEGWGRE